MDGVCFVISHSIRSGVSLLMVLQWHRCSENINGSGVEDEGGVRISVQCRFFIGSSMERMFGKP